MTLEEKVLRGDIRNNYTEHDVKKHLKDGVYVYDDYDEFFTMWCDCLGEPEEAPDAWEQLDRAIVDDKEYRYDVAL